MGEASTDKEGLGVRWERAAAPVRRVAERFPWERALLLGVAAVDEGTPVGVVTRRAILDALRRAALADRSQGAP